MTIYGQHSALSEHVASIVVLLCYNQVRYICTFSHLASRNFCVRIFVAQLWVGPTFSIFLDHDSYFCFWCLLAVVAQQSKSTDKNL